MYRNVWEMYKNNNSIKFVKNNATIGFKFDVHQSCIAR